MKIAALTDYNPDNLLLWPDSVMVRSGKPVFIPDSTRHSEYDIRFAICARICRLGRCVEQRFASRYFDQAMPVALILPAEASDALRNGTIPLASDIFFDGCIVLGEPFSPDPQTAETLERSIPVASERMMLKIGDLVISPLPADADSKAVIGQRYQYNPPLLSQELPREPLLRFSIK